MRVIVDTSVLIALDRIGHINLLRRLFGSADESTSSPAIPVFLFSDFRQGRRPALKQGRSEGSFFGTTGSRFSQEHARKSPPGALTCAVKQHDFCRENLGCDAAPILMPAGLWRAMDEDYQADGVDVWPKPPGRVRAARFGTSRRL